MSKKYKKYDTNMAFALDTRNRNATYPRSCSARLVYYIGWRIGVNGAQIKLRLRAHTCFASARVAERRAIRLANMDFTLFLLLRVADLRERDSAKKDLSDSSR